MMVKASLSCARTGTGVLSMRLVIRLLTWSCNIDRHCQLIVKACKFWWYIDTKYLFTICDADVCILIRRLRSK